MQEPTPSQHKLPVLCVVFGLKGLHVMSGDSNGLLFIHSVKDGNIMWRSQGNVALLSIKWDSFLEEGNMYFVAFKMRHWLCLMYWGKA